MVASHFIFQRISMRVLTENLTELRKAIIYFHLFYELLLVLRGFCFLTRHWVLSRIQDADSYKFPTATNIYFTDADIRSKSISYLVHSYVLLETKFSPSVLLPVAISFMLSILLELMTITVFSCLFWGLLARELDSSTPLFFLRKMSKILDFFI